MDANIWMDLRSDERTLLLNALRLARKATGAPVSEIDAMTVKLVHAEAHPNITIGVHGGQVQWTLGNPFPIHICDYDGEPADLPDVDERGQKCRMWLEPADLSMASS